jgi:tetratricopeptide (TPR) repeat protein
MKHHVILIQLSLTLLIAMIFFACSSTSEKISEDEFFEPVDKIVHKKDGTVDFPLVLTRERYALHPNDGMKDTIMMMLREQNKQLNDVVQQLNLLTKKELADTLKSRENLSDLLTTRDRVSNGMLLEMIREQNQRLNDVIERLKLLSRGDDVELRDNCQFWMGVCYFNLNRINEAIDDFTGVLSTVGSDKTESAYFMLGQCYEQIGAKKDAEIAFEKMLREYPRGSLKQVAEIKLALLK